MQELLDIHSLSKSHKYFLITLIWSIMAFTPFLGHIHLLDWDEVNFALSSREMIESENYLQVTVNGEPFWEKPPLFFWIQTISFKLFENTEFAARFVSALSGIMTTLLIFFIGKQIISPSFGLIWSLLYSGSCLSLFISKMGIMDPTLNLFIIGGIFAYIRMITLQDRPYFYAVLSSICLAIAFLIKGPIAIIIPALVFIMYFFFYNKSQLNLRHNLFFILLLCIFSMSWYLVESFRNGFWFIEQFIIYQFKLVSTADADHKGFFLFHFLVFILLCFPASTFFITGIKNNWKADDFSKIMALLFTIVIVIFFIVKTKIVHYSSLVYIPGCYFSALAIHDFTTKKRVLLSKIEWSILTCSLSVYLILTLLLPILINNPETIIPYISDINVVETISQKIHWSFVGFIPGIFLLLTGILVSYFFYHQSIVPGLKLLIISTMIFTNSLWAFYLPNLEKYLQGDLVNYYKNIKDQPIDLTTYQYKTYAHIFYGGKKVFASIEDYNNSIKKELQLHIITRKHSQAQIENKYPVKLLHQFGQFLVYEYIP